MKQIFNRIPTRLAADTYPDWHVEAACVGKHELFFAEIGASGHNDAVRTETIQAKHICWTECPVRIECLHEALSQKATDDRHGVWGGYSTKERQQLRRQRRTA